MKKYIIIISLLLVFSATIFAQDKKHEIVLGYGVMTNYAIEEVLKNITVTIVTLGLYDTEYESGTGAFLLGYRYFPSEKFSIGIDVAYTKINDVVKSHDTVVVGNIERHFYTLAPYAVYNYIKKEKFRLYSGIGLGYAFGKDNYKPNNGAEENENFGRIAYQLNAIGVRFGTKVGGYVEFGYGYKGMLNFGVSVKL